MAAAEGGLLFVELVERDGLSSLLFFLDRPPERMVEEVVPLAAGLIGEESREALGELVADEP